MTEIKYVAQEWNNDLQQVERAEGNLSPEVYQLQTKTARVKRFIDLNQTLTSFTTRYKNILQFDLQQMHELGANVAAVDVDLRKLFEQGGNADG